MAVAMEAGWGPAGGVSTMRSEKRAWGADAEKLVQAMAGQFSGAGEISTLDLLSTAGGGSEAKFGAVDEFLGVEPEQPLPPGWERCLDLKTGEVYFVDKRSGARAGEDPRRHHHQRAEAIAPRTPARPAHEFLASKREEALRASPSSGSSGEDAAACGLSLSAWRARDDSSFSSSAAPALELNLNLSPLPVPVPPAQTVCTMEMVQQALKRTEKAMGKRAATASSSSLSWSRSSPSTSTSSTSKSTATPPRVHGEAESSRAVALELAMGKCTRCSMMVMVHKHDPKCPGCESEVGLVSFASGAPSPKRRRVDAAAFQ